MMSPEVDVMSPEANQRFSEELGTSAKEEQFNSNINLEEKRLTQNLNILNGAMSEDDEGLNSELL